MNGVSDVDSDTVASVSVAASTVDTGASVIVSVSLVIGVVEPSDVSTVSLEVAALRSEETAESSVSVSEVIELSLEVSEATAASDCVTLVTAAVSVARLGGATSSHPASQSVTPRLAAKATSLNVDGFLFILNVFSKH